MLGSAVRVFAALVFCLALMGLTSCRAYNQSASEVAVREPGDHFLRKPSPVQMEASKHLQFALLSEAAYQNTVHGQQQDPIDRATTDPTPNAPDKAKAEPLCPDPATSLQNDFGWVRWPDFPNDGLRDQIKDSHLRVEVWYRKSPAAVVVAFGGTVFNNGNDWRANLRWFTPKTDDEYTQVVKTVGPKFQEELKRRSVAPDWSFLKQATLYATGHSLGGGLAQQFAYAWPLDSDVPRITHVYAFDPSPVTGFYSVEPAIRDYNKRYLYTDRVYERGEILALLRSLLAVFYPPSAAEPTIRSVRYNLFATWNPVSGHSISQLTCKLSGAVKLPEDHKE